MWTEFASNWASAMSRLQTRFPNLGSETKLDTFAVPADLADHIAHNHDLTQFEAAEELNDWMFVENLARQAMELDAGRS